MSEISLILVLHLIINETLKDLAKVQIKSEKLTPFGGFFRFVSKITLSPIGCELRMKLICKNMNIQNEIYRRLPQFEITLILKAQSDKTPVLNLLVFK